MLDVEILLAVLLVVATGAGIGWVFCVAPGLREVLDRDDVSIED